MLITQSCSTLQESVGSQNPPGSSVPGVSRQEDWSGLPCPPPVDLPHPGIEPASPTLQADSLPLEPAEKAHRQGWNNWKSPTFLRSLRELKKQGKLRRPNQERQMKVGHHRHDKLTQKRGWGYERWKQFYNNIFMNCWGLRLDSRVRNSWGLQFQRGAKLSCGFDLEEPLQIRTFLKSQEKMLSRLCPGETQTVNYAKGVLGNSNLLAKGCNLTWAVFHTEDKCFWGSSFLPPSCLTSRNKRQGRTG